MGKYGILIVEDDTGLNQGIALALREEEVSFHHAYSLGEAREAWQQKAIDMILLDLNLPDGSGYDFLREVRKMSDIPVLLITANDLEIDEVTGFSLGADDYIVKPFSPREVIARIKAVLRRMNEQSNESKSTLRFPGLEINLDNYEIRSYDKILPCTPKEVEILHLLASHPGQVFDREQILSRVWGYDFFGDTRTVDTHIKRIRQKLPQENVPWCLRTVYGVGYKFEVNQ